MGMRGTTDVPQRRRPLGMRRVHAGAVGWHRQALDYQGASAPVAYGRDADSAHEDRRRD